MSLAMGAASMVEPTIIFRRQETTMNERNTSDRMQNPVKTRSQQADGTGSATADADHRSTSSEGEGTNAGEKTSGLIESSSPFSGEGGLGELERVAGFDESQLASDSAAGQMVPVTADLENLPDAGSLEYVSAETVCGSDNRTRITNTTVFAWRAICQLILRFRNGATARGTGWFIGPHTVMTAGHCVYSHANGGWAQQIEVIPGMNAAARPYGSLVGTSFRSVTGWTGSASGDPEHDYGAIILPNDTLGNRVGWFGFAVLTDAALSNLLVNLSGYAGDKPFGTQWFMAGNVSSVANRRLHYMVDTFGGQSGSPVWRLNAGQRHAVGVHAYGGCPNGATRITKPVFDNMMAWKA
jgi:V8-like Glu-specific endopeptidase